MLRASIHLPADRFRTRSSLIPSGPAVTSTWPSPPEAEPVRGGRKTAPFRGDMGYRMRGFKTQSFARKPSRNSQHSVPSKGCWTHYAFTEVGTRIPTGDLHWHGAVCAGAGSYLIRRCHSQVDVTHTVRYEHAGLSGNDIAICLIHEGSHTVELPDGRKMSFCADQLFALDYAQQIRHHWSDSAVSYLWLPRGLVHETISPDQTGVSAVAVALGNAKLAPFLAAQLNLLRAQSAELAPNTLHHVLNATIDLANLIVRSELLNSVGASARRLDGRMFAVWRYIEENLHKHDLAPKEIAQAINCSRAQLYRLFETQPFTVREAIKEARLKRSLHYLVRSDRKFDLGEIAAVCGFTDQSAFGKQFRQRFGLAPGKARRTGACATLSAPLEADEHSPLS